MNLIIFIVIIVLASAILFIGRFYGSKMPVPAGVGTGDLANCELSPTCISTLSKEDSHRIEPLTLKEHQTPADAISILAEILVASARSRVIMKNDTYLHVENHGLILNLIDDIEFLVDKERRQIHARLASRLNVGGTNASRARYTTISKEFAIRSIPDENPV